MLDDFNEELVSDEQLVERRDAERRALKRAQPALDDKLKELLTMLPYDEITESLNDLNWHTGYEGWWHMYAHVPELQPIRAQIISDVDNGENFSRDAYKSMRHGLVDDNLPDYSLKALKAQPRHSLPLMQMGLTIGYVALRARSAESIQRLTPGGWFLREEEIRKLRRDEFDEHYLIGVGLRCNLLGVEHIDPEVISLPALDSAFHRYLEREKEYSISQAVPRITMGRNTRFDPRYATG